ncbi:TPA: molybdopterin synthase sulfur carrier subunit [Candidatus Acetothermia bacterium]|nr:molybdopterin synthase sulfur carrier subunit [Candidatus Acetothermia bacterium]
MKVEVHVFFPFRAEIGEGTIALDLPTEADVAAAVAALVERYPLLRERIYGSNGRIRRHVSALVNGTSIQFKQGLATALTDGDVLTLLPPVGGG